MSGIKRLFWDIETSPNIALTWRTGYKINLSHENIVSERGIICICYKWEGQDDVHCLTWDNGDDTNPVKEFSKIVEEADELVAHNGNKFDLKWYNTRHLMLGLEPIPQSKTIDTLSIAKRKFYLNSNRLDYLGKILLGEGKIDVPYSLWVRITLDNEPSALEEMVRYCKQDVVLLEKVYKRLSAYDTPKTHAGVFDGGPRWSCAHCGSMDVGVSKTLVTAKGVKQKQFKCRECGRYYTTAENVWRDYVLAREESST
jgi:hypothetical protein